MSAVRRLVATGVNMDCIPDDVRHVTYKYALGIAHGPVGHAVITGPIWFTADI